MADSTPLFSENEITRVAFAMHENRGAYALLIGSGLSRAAEIPTGWEITINLIKRVAISDGEQDQSDWAAWYREKTGKEPNYSELLAELGLSPDERRSILHNYIEPSEEAREDGRKVPTEAHYAIADLVRTEYVRVIVTTNFDRLLESALRERGVEPTIVASVDSLKGAEPLTHTQCYLLKLHGDYKDARILNTDSELASYPPEYDALLDRIFDEFGLLVCGWSAEWDHALRDAISRTPARRYSTFWIARKAPSTAAADLIEQRRANLVLVKEAEEFFTTLRDRIEVLAQTNLRNPQTVELLVNCTKRYIAKPEHRIQLDDLLSSEVLSLMDKLEQAALPTQNVAFGVEFPRQVAIFESATEPLARMVGVLGRWGDDGEYSNAIGIVRSMLSFADRVRDGVVPFVYLRAYPAILLLTAYGIGLTSAQRWGVLHRLFCEPVEIQGMDGPKRAVEALFLQSWEAARTDAWKPLEGTERHKTPFSQHLYEIFKLWGASFVGIVPSFEELYETWEILGSLCYSEKFSLEQFERADPGNPGPEFEFVPVGRSGWNIQVRNRVIEKIQSGDVGQGLLGANFCKGRQEFLNAAVGNYQRVAARVAWSL